MATVINNLGPTSGPTPVDEGPSDPTGAPIDVRPEGFDPSWLEQDFGAAEAIDRLKQDEAGEDFVEICNIGDSNPGPLGPIPGPFGSDPPEPSIPGTYLVPTNNQLTGQELTGYVLEGTADRGNELNELHQFQGLRNDPAVKPDPAAKRVLDVVDKWVAKLESEGRTALTPEEKAQMAAEMSDAAKPRESDYAQPIGLPIEWPIVEG